MGFSIQNLSWRPIGWCALVAVWIMSFVYTATPLSGHVLCLFKRITTWPCPGCGLTRSFVAMSSADIPGAFAFHLAGPFLYVAMLLAIGLPLLRRALGTRQLPPIPSRAQRIFWWFFVVLYIGQAVRAASSWRPWGDFPFGVV